MRWTTRVAPTLTFALLGASWSGCNQLQSKEPGADQPRKPPPAQRIEPAPPARPSVGPTAKKPPAKATATPKPQAHKPAAECWHVVERLWFDAARGRAAFCLTKSKYGEEEEEPVELPNCDEVYSHEMDDCKRKLKQAKAAQRARKAAKARAAKRVKRVCYSLDPGSGATQKVAPRLPPAPRSRVRIRGRRIKACPAGDQGRCVTLRLRRKPLQAELSASGLLLAALTMERNKQRTGEDADKAHAWWVEVYELKSRRRRARFVVDRGSQGLEVSLQWLGEVLVSSWVQGPGGSSHILDWKAGKKLRTLGTDAKHDTFGTSYQRAQHLSGNRWAVLSGGGNPLVIQDMVTNAVSRVTLDALYGEEKWTGRNAAADDLAAAMAVVSPKRLVVLTAAPQVIVAVVDADSGKLVHTRALGCPALEDGPAAR